MKGCSGVFRDAGIPSERKLWKMYQPEPSEKF
jgi:hypothetical protein